jgi:hypothetical protein
LVFAPLIDAVIHAYDIFWAGLVKYPGEQPPDWEWNKKRLNEGTALKSHNCSIGRKRRDMNPPDALQRCPTNR